MYELETTDMQLRTKTARRATSASTFTAVTARARPAGTGPSQTTWQGGTAVFALLALAGDVGCSAGPGLVGLVSGGAGLNAGLMAACVFPVLMLASALCLSLRRAAGR